MYEYRKHCKPIILFCNTKQDLRDEIRKYEDILKRMKDYDDNLAKEKLALATQEEQKRRLEVIYLVKFMSVKSV